MAWMQSRAFVGPKYQPSTSDYFYDWSALDIAEELPAIATSLCSLDGTINATATSIDITVDTGSGVPPSAGGCWISGNATGQAWEYIAYSGVTDNGGGSYTLTGCVREPALNREHNGSHNNGATVRFFWQLDTMSGEFSLVREMNDEECVIDWSAEATGWIFPQAALRDGHLFVYQTRTSLDAPNDVFRNVLIGFINNPNSEHDYRHVGQWTVKIGSSAMMLNRYPSPGIRYGDFNLANGATVQSSEPLSMAWKERHSGDYIAAEPDFSGDSIVDGDMKTLWIGERYIGTGWTEYDIPDAFGTDRTGSAEIIISQIHITGPTGQPYGHRWIELTEVADHEWGNFTICIGTENSDGIPTLDLRGKLGNKKAGDKIIICENADRFAEDNPDHSATQIISLVDEQKYDLLQRSLTAGSLGIYRDAGGVREWLSLVSWGTGSKAHAKPDNETTVYHSPDWIGTTIPAITANSGKTLRYNWSNAAAQKDNWDYGYYQHPGFKVVTGGVGWVLLELPPLGLILAEDLTNSYTGVIRITDGTQDTTGGLPSSGDIQIGDEILSYNNRTVSTINITARGVSSTTAAAHAKDDPVYVSDSGVAVDALPIRAVKIKRVGANVPKNIVIRGAKLSYNVGVPGDYNYTADYDWSETITGNTSQNLEHSLSATRRMRYLLIEISLMTDNPSRPRINEVEVVPGEAYYDSSTWLNSGESGDEFATHVLTNVGFPPSAITANAAEGGSGHTTANKMAWEVLASYAQYAGLLIEVGLDSKITINDNDYMIGGILTTAQTWTKSNSASVKYAGVSPENVSQVKIPWVNHDASLSGVVVFPETPGEQGDVFELDEQVYDDEASALARAEQLYYRLRYPYSWLVEPAEITSLFAPREIHATSDWKFNGEMQAIDRTCFVQSAEYSVTMNKSNDMRWEGVLQLVEIDRRQP